MPVGAAKLDALNSLSLRIADALDDRYEKIAIRYEAKPPHQFRP
jgi:hypothetical protein